MSLSMYSLEILVAKKMYETIEKTVEIHKEPDEIRDNYKGYLKNFKSNNENKFFKY